MLDVVNFFNAVCPTGLQDTQPRENGRQEKSTAEIASTLVSTGIKCVGLCAWFGLR